MGSREIYLTQLGGRREEDFLADFSLQVSDASKRAVQGSFQSVSVVSRLTLQVRNV